MMPGMDGLELLRAIRADSHTRHIPIILLSARAGEESRVEGLDAGADDYLVKPFAARELRARVNAHANLADERRRATEELNARFGDLQRANADLRDARRATCWKMPSRQAAGRNSYTTNCASKTNGSSVSARRCEQL